MHSRPQDLPASALLLAALLLLPGCGGSTAPVVFTGAAAAQAASGAAVSIATTFGVDLAGLAGLFDSSAAPPSTIGFATSVLRSVRREALSENQNTAGNAVIIADTCPCGGAIQKSCGITKTTSVFAASLANCCITDDLLPGKQIFATGGLLLTVDDPSACLGAGVLPSSTQTLSFSNFGIIVNDASGSRAGTLVAAGLNLSYEPTGSTGCAGPDATFILSGGLDVTSTTDGLNLALSFVNLTSDSQSTAGTGACQGQALLNGTLAVSDRAGGRSFSVGFSDTGIASSSSGTAVDVSIDGTTALSCTGEATFTTAEPLALASGETCPTAGRLTVALPDGTSGIHYTSAGGLEIDIGDDGSVDQSFATCDDPQLARCRG